MQTTQYNHIDDVNGMKDDWVLNVMIVRIWFSTYNMDMVFVDEKGGKIHSILKQNLQAKFRAQLREGKQITIANVGVGTSSGQYKPTSNQYRLFFKSTTIVTEVLEPTISKYGFSFTTFEDILNNQCDQSVLVDVIGFVANIKNVGEFERNGQSVKRVTFELLDTKKNTMDCTLFGSTANELMNYMENNNQPTFIIVQFGKINSWNGALEEKATAMLKEIKD